MSSETDPGEDFASQSGRHEVERHPRNGYAITRVLVPMMDGVPLPSGIAFTANLALSDRFDRPQLEPGPDVGVDDLLPLPSNWHASRCTIRTIVREGPQRSSLDQHALRVAHDLWKLDGFAEAEERLITSEAREKPAKRFYAEIAACWSVTLGCEDCKREAIMRTAVGAVSILRMFGESATYGLQMPITPLPVELFRESQVVYVEEYSLANELVTVHDVETTGQIDPRRAMIGDDNQKLTSAQAVNMAEVMFSLSLKHEASQYYAFMSEAYSTLYLHQNPSVAVLLAAQACETILDVALVHMSWWEGLSPEEVARKLSQGIVRRVHSHYSRLGGNWDVSSSPPLAAWKKCVADTRNRIAHGGKSAVSEEGIEAVTAARQLYGHLCDMAHREAGRARFPLLAGVLAWDGTGTVGTRRQKAVAQWYYQGPARPYQTFGFYRSLVNRARWAAIGNPISPRIEHAEPYLTVWRDSDEIVWWLYDRETHHVIPADTPNLEARTRRELVTHYQEEIRPGLDQDSFSHWFDHPLSPTEGSDWQDACEALPWLFHLRSDVHPPAP